MSCSNCYNGCPEIISDQCVKYTGVDIPILGIKNGDSLSYVEQAIIGFLTSTLDGSGIIINIPQTSYCNLVTSNLPTCGEITATVLFEAIVKSACQLQEQVTAQGDEIDSINNTLDELNGSYNVSCLLSVTPNSGTHNILQAVINTLCQFIADVETNYVQAGAELDALIQAYLDSIAPSSKQYMKMVPYTVVEYYGDLFGKFDITGAGYDDWEKIYLCNGNNGTPDKRGRVPVGVVNGMGGGALDPAVDPADPVFGAFNPNYSISGINSKAGTNAVLLTRQQMPSHTHDVTVSLNPHNHTVSYGTGGFDTGSTPAVTSVGVGGTSSGLIDDTTLVVSNGYTGGGDPHQNNQPALACYYIMYIP